MRQWTGDHALRNMALISERWNDEQFFFCNRRWVGRSIYLEDDAQKKKKKKETKVCRLNKILKPTPLGG